MRKELVDLLQIYDNPSIDWMSFQITKNNPYSFHHIKKVHEKGEDSVDNGAILSRKSHRLLNWIEENHPLIYLDWEELFTIINKEQNFEMYESRSRELKRISLELRYR